MGWASATPRAPAARPTSRRSWWPTPPRPGSWRRALDRGRPARCAPATAAWPCPTGSRCRRTGRGHRATWPGRATSTGGAAPRVRPRTPTSGWRSRSRPPGPPPAAGDSGADSGAGARQVAAVLRHHGGGPWGSPGAAADEVEGLPPAVVDRLGTGVSLCMHLRGIQATTSSLITWLPRDPDQTVRGWVAPGNPCVSVFVPTFGVAGIAPELADPATWDRFAALAGPGRAEPGARRRPGPGGPGRDPRRAGPDRSRAVGRGRRRRRWRPHHAGALGERAVVPHRAGTGRPRRLTLSHPPPTMRPWLCRCASSGSVGSPP